jgi:hypothetical protein
MLSSLERGDLDVVIGHLKEDVRHIDHRPLGGEPLSGRRQVRAQFASIIEHTGSLILSAKIAGERDGVILTKQTYAGQAAAKFGGGPFEIVVWVLHSFNGNLISRIDVFGDEAQARVALEEAAVAR